MSSEIGVEAEVETKKPSVRNVVIRPYFGSKDDRCTQGDCNDFTYCLIHWEHMHHGVWKPARPRLRCLRHARKFCAKHGVTMVKF